MCEKYCTTEPKLLFFSLFKDKVLYSPDRPQTCYVAEDCFEFLILSPLLLECWDYRPAPSCLSMWHWRLIDVRHTPY